MPEAHPTLRWFEYKHLPEDSRWIPQVLGDFALRLDAELPPSAELAAGYRKLLEAKDCFVRALIDARDKGGQ